MNTRERFQGLFIIVGIVLVVLGLNSSYPLAVVGGSLIGLALVGRFLGKTENE